MKCWRVMGNNLKRGTWCEIDQIPSHSDAIDAKIASQKMYPDDNFFVQEYEEARTGKLEQRSSAT